MSPISQLLAISSLLSVPRRADRLPTSHLLLLPSIRRRELASRADSLAKEDEDPWHDGEQSREHAQHRRCKGGAEAKEQVVGDEGRDATEDVAAEGLGGEGGAGVAAVGVCEVVEDLGWGRKVSGWVLEGACWFGWVGG